MTRTTLDIDPSVLRELRARGELERKSMGQVASELLASALSTPARQTARQFSWSSADLGAPRFDLEDKGTVARSPRQPDMSVTVDANVLVYASNEADAAHVPARTLIERLAAGPELVYLFWPVLMGYLRIVTHPAILPRPLAPGNASENVRGLLSLAHVRSPGEAEGFWEMYGRCAGRHTRGNAVPDAHIAALMRLHGVETIYTRDRDYRRFDGIRARDPFA